MYIMAEAGHATREPCLRGGGVSHAVGKSRRGKWECCRRKHLNIIIYTASSLFAGRKKLLRLLLVALVAFHVAGADECGIAPAKGSLSDVRATNVIFIDI